MADSWVKIYRKFQRHPFWTKRRKFSEAEAWLDLIMSANWDDSQMMIDHRTVTLQRGSLITSEPILSARWGRSRTWVRSFLVLLSDEKMCTKISDSKKTTVTILNYELYQGNGETSLDEKNSEKTAEKHLEDMRKTVGNTQSKKNKNIKKNEEELVPVPLEVHKPASSPVVDGCVWFRMSENEKVLAQEYYRKSGYPLEAMQFVINQVESWLATDSAKAIKARKANSHSRRLYEAWAVEKGLAAYQARKPAKTSVATPKFTSANDRRAQSFEHNMQMVARAAEQESCLPGFAFTAADSSVVDITPKKIGFESK